MIEIDAIPRFRSLDDRVFLLGLGAMKCATSWTYHYLADLPGVTTSPIKEINFFNELFPEPHRKSLVPKIIQRVQDYCNLPGETSAELMMNPHFQASVDRMKMIFDPAEYLNHFSRLATPETRAFCEISPRYALLSSAGFEMIQKYFQTQHLELRVFFVMRDPVERMWSQLRYAQQYNEISDLKTNWRNYLRNRAVLEYADYRRTIETIEMVFSPDAIQFLFYEEIVFGHGTETLCNFLGLPYRSGNTDRRQNETTVKADMPNEVRRALLHLLEPQYEFCRRRFGKQVPSAWA